MEKKKKKDGNTQGKKRPLILLTTKGIAGWLCLFFFISAWMFVLGVFVGRGIAPVRFDVTEIQKDLEELKSAILKKEQTKNRNFADVLDKGPGLDFHENLRGTNDDVYEKETPKVKKKRVPEKDIPRKKTDDTAKRVKRDKSLQKEKTVTKTATNKKEKNLTIQVAAFKSAKEADAFVAQLKKKRYSAYRVIGKGSDKDIWYRVRVGAFETKADASKTVNRLKREKIQAIIVNR